MTIVRISVDGEEYWGVPAGDAVLTTERPLPLAAVDFADLDVTMPASSIRVVAPLEPGAKVLCVGLNYRDHVLEMGREMPTHPVIFTRFTDSLVGPGEPLIMPSQSSSFDYEGELAIVIGKQCRAVSEDDAFDYVLGYTLVNDGSLRDFQRHSIQFTPGKNFPRSGAIGPWIVTPDEVPDIENQPIRTSVNDEIRQDSSIAQLIFTVPQLVAYVSSWTALRPGDVIATGTPGGVGDSFNPPRWLHSGDTVRVDIPQIGSLVNPVMAERDS